MMSVSHLIRAKFFLMICKTVFFPVFQSNRATSTDFPQDQELPENLVKTGFCDLMVRQPRGNQQKNRPQTENGMTVWNGKPVKNFKKFRKVKILTILQDEFTHCGLVTPYGEIEIGQH